MSLHRGIFSSVQRSHVMNATLLLVSLAIIGVIAAQAASGPGRVAAAVRAQRPGSTVAAQRTAPTQSPTVVVTSPQVSAPTPPVTSAAGPVGQAAQSVPVAGQTAVTSGPVEAARSAAATRSAIPAPSATAAPTVSSPSVSFDARGISGSSTPAGAGRTAHALAAGTGADQASAASPSVSGAAHAGSSIAGATAGQSAADAGAGSSVSSLDSPYDFPFGSGPGPSPDAISPADWAEQVELQNAGLSAGAIYQPSDFATGAYNPTLLASLGFVEMTSPTGTTLWVGPDVPQALYPLLGTVVN
jgi:hypothetical protein